MDKDKQVIHHLWWLNKFLSDQFKDKPYKEVIHMKLDAVICNEVEALGAHIKQNY